ncbi:MAG: glycerol-3-phosphate 1-O-acyltransferase PlsY [Clostridiales bacterium]|jgi:glycerol-3-phosphate acyltransferase PlsY|nr:glycerol-3-phosphate 1-O-acyltransferase PlsY [Clostridiales bacterium]
MYDFYQWVLSIGIVYFVLAIVIAYFLGNISPATIISKAARIDIRKKGSGNPGTTNVLRVIGPKAAAITLAIDIIKGVVAVLIGKYIGGETLAVICGLAVFIGHIWPIVFKFKGGKGIATGFGVLLTLNYVFALICLAIAAIGFVVSKRVSVGSLLSALSIPIIANYFMPDYVVLLSAMTVIIFVKHRSNIKRLIKGEEPKVSFKKEERNES